MNQEDCRQYYNNCTEKELGKDIPGRDPDDPDPVCTYNNETLSADMICAFGGKEGTWKDTCQTDSGGPLVTKVDGHYVVVGIVSWIRSTGTHDPCSGKERYPGIYARVNHVLDWIRKYINREAFQITKGVKSKLGLLHKKLIAVFHVRILTSFGAGDLGSEVDFLYAMMWVTKVTF